MKKQIKKITTIITVLVLGIVNVVAQKTMTPQEYYSEELEKAQKNPNGFAFNVNGYTLQKDKTSKIVLIDNYTYYDDVIAEDEEAVELFKKVVDNKRESKIDSTLKTLIRWEKKAEGEEKVKFGEWIEARKACLPLIEEKNKAYDKYTEVYNNWKKITDAYNEWKKVNKALETAKTASYSFYDLNDNKNTLRVKKGKITLGELKGEEALAQFNKIGDGLKVAQNKAQKEFDKSSKAHDKARALIALSDWSGFELEFRELMEQKFQEALNRSKK